MLFCYQTMMKKLLKCILCMNDSCNEAVGVAVGATSESSSIAMKRGPAQPTDGVKLSCLQTPFKDSSSLTSTSVSCAQCHFLTHVSAETLRSAAHGKLACRARSCVDSPSSKTSNARALTEATCAICMDTSSNSMARMTLEGSGLPMQGSSSSSSFFDTIDLPQQRPAAPSGFRPKFPRSMAQLISLNGCKTSDLVLYEEVFLDGPGHQSACGSMPAAPVLLMDADSFDEATVQQLIQRHQGGALQRLMLASSSLPPPLQAKTTWCLEVMMHY